MRWGGEKPIIPQLFMGASSCPGTVLSAGDAEMNKTLVSLPSVELKTLVSLPSVEF